MEWQDISTAPKDGRPIWVKGFNYGSPIKGYHCLWAWWDGASWRDCSVDQGTLQYLEGWLEFMSDQSER